VILPYHIQSQEGASADEGLLPEKTRYERIQAFFAVPHTVRCLCHCSPPHAMLTKLFSRPQAHQLSPILVLVHYLLDLLRGVTPKSNHNRPVQSGCHAYSLWLMMATVSSCEPRKATDQKSPTACGAAN